MLYCSERNVGCRFVEISLYGMRALVLENERLHVTVLLDHGADILEFNYKKTDTDFVWRNPMGLSGIRKLQLAPVDADGFADNYLGGFFEILPSIGGGGDYRGIRMGGYCESNQLPWEYAVECDEPQRITVRCFVRLNKLPLLLTRRMTLHSGSAALCMEETVENLGLEPVDFQWGWHPNIGGGFLCGDCVVDLPGRGMRVLRPSRRFSQQAVGTWPVLREPDAGSRPGVDYSRVLPEDTMLDELVDVETPDEGWAAVRDVRRGLGIGLSWDPEVFPYAAVWQSSCHREGHFRLGGAYVMCFLLHSTRTWGLPQAAAAGETVPLPGRAVRCGRLTLTAFEGDRPVDGVAADGSVRFCAPDRSC